MNTENSNPLLDAVPIARRSLTIFLCIDTSGSMSGVKIGTVNCVIRELIPQLHQLSDSNADAEISMAVQTFSSNASWALMPTPVENIVWSDLGAAGPTNIDEAFEDLNSRLSRNGFMSSPSGSYSPVIIFMSDGHSTTDYHHALNQLKQNKWFHYAIKAGIGIGEDADLDMLAEFTGDKELVVTAPTPEALAAIIKFMSITSSKISSQSCGVGRATNSQGQPVEQKQAMFAQQLQEFKNESPDIQALSHGF